MGVKNSELLRFWKNYDRRCEFIVRFVKYFGRRYQVTGGGLGHHLNSYALVLMVIFFLQTKDILPSVASLQDDVPEDICESWNCAFNRERKTSTNNTQSITELLMEFFQFYNDFDFICSFPWQNGAFDNQNAWFSIKWLSIVGFKPLQSSFFFYKLCQSFIFFFAENASVPLELVAKLACV